MYSVNETEEMDNKHGGDNMNKFYIGAKVYSVKDFWTDKHEAMIIISINGNKVTVRTPDNKIKTYVKGNLI